MTAFEFMTGFLFFTIYTFGILPFVMDGKFRNMSPYKFVYGLVLLPLILSFVLAMIVF